MRVEGSRMRNTTLGGASPGGNCFSTPMMVRECPSCCRYSGGLSAWQPSGQPSNMQAWSRGAKCHANHGGDESPWACSRGGVSLCMTPFVALIVLTYPLCKATQDCRLPHQCLYVSAQNGAATSRSKYTQPSHSCRRVQRMQSCSGATSHTGFAVIAEQPGTALCE